MGDNSPEKLSYQSLLKQACQVLGVVAWLQFLSFDFLLFSLCLVYHPFFSLSSSLGSVLSKSTQTATFFALDLERKWSSEGCLVLWDSSHLLLFRPHLFLFSHLPLWTHSVICISPCRGVFFSILKPCWLPGHRLPASWSVVLYFLQVLLLTGVCCFVTHWLASSKNPPSLHHAQKVLSVIWSIHFARFFFWTCTNEHTHTVTQSPNKCCTRNQKKNVFFSVGRASFQQKKRLIAPH